jgi:lysophospholipase L1-like esterase
VQLSVIRFLLSAMLATTLTSCGSGPAFPFNDSLNATTAFMGDSITQFWRLPDHNKGISGQTTAQMLDRFNGDVLGHGFKRVVILGGTNDIGLHQILSNVSLNLDAMAAMAQGSGIEVVLCTLPPIFGQNLSDQVTYVNKEITALARSRGYQLVDYFTPMAGHPEYFIDGVHPDKLGYSIMETTLSRVVIK